MKNNKGRKLPGEVLTTDEIKNLLASFPATRVGIRNRALVAVTLYAALRCQEALDLQPSDVNLAGGSVLVRNGKGGKRGVVGLNKAAIPYLESWLSIRPNERLLFTTQAGRPVLACYYRAMLQRAKRAAGIDHRIHCHALRHTAAVTLAKRRVPLPIVQRQLRHTSLQTTQTYLNHFSAQDVVDQVSEVDW